MPLNEQDFSKLKEMQQLLYQVECDLRKLTKFRNSLASSRIRYSKLQELYHNDWLRLTESEELDKQQREEIERLVHKGHYSIFWQDTIWNALNDTYTEKLELIEILKQHL